MILYNESGKTIEIKSTCIASGGEGEIFVHPTNSKEVIKVYHQSRDISFKSLLLKLQSLDNRFVKPVEIFYDSNKKIAGFSMNFVNFNNYHLFNNLFNKGFCTKNNITYDFKISILEKMKDATEYLHSQEILIGDFNCYNLFFSLKGEILFVDVDSYSELNNPRPAVLLEEIRDFTSSVISKNTDIYAFDVLSFWSLTHLHPFKYVAAGNSENLEQRMRANKSMLSNIPNIKIPPIYNPLPTILESQFKEIFNGRRYFIDFNNVPTQVNVQINNTVISSSSLSIQEIEKDIIQMFTCGNRIAVQTNKEWHIYDGSNTKALNLKHVLVNPDLVFPSNNNYCKVLKDNLYSSKGDLIRSLTNCYYYYQNGQLFILDYYNDAAYIYNIDEQLIGIGNIRHSVFAKSIVIRQAIIQDFGKVKMSGRLMNKNLSLFTIPHSTKDLIIENEFVCLESIENGKIVTTLNKIVGTNLAKILYTNTLTNFTNKGDIIFIPEDNNILVYNLGNLIEKLDCPSTTSSKLHICNAGIVMLENNKLYLLNKK